MDPLVWLCSHFVVEYNLFEFIIIWMCWGQYAIAHHKNVERGRHDAHLSFTFIWSIFVILFCLWFVLLLFRYQFKLYRNRFDHKDGKISEFIRQQSKYNAQAEAKPKRRWKKNMSNITCCPRDTCAGLSQNRIFCGKKKEHDVVYIQWNKIRFDSSVVFICNSYVRFFVQCNSDIIILEAEWETRRRWKKNIQHSVFDIRCSHIDFSRTRSCWFPNESNQTIEINLLCCQQIPF